MKEIVALKELIEKNEKRIKLFKRQLSDHESGEKKLSRIMLASAETNVVEVSDLISKHQVMLDELLKQDLEELEREEALKEAIRLENYYKFQNMRIRRNKTHPSDIKLEAMLILDQLPSQIQYEDKEIFELAEQFSTMNLRGHDEIQTLLSEIRKSFENLTKDIDEENIGDIALFNVHIPIIVLHFSILALNVNKTITDEGLDTFSGFPKYEDWWINELWVSHQAYFGLYKWKSIIENQCITTEQKRAWDIIFSNWLFLKKLINTKGEIGFHYNFAFDSLLNEYAQVEEELSNVNLLTMETIVKNITIKEDFNAVMKNHNIITPYVEYKRRKAEDTK